MSSSTVRSEIPVDVLRLILDHIDTKADLAIVCLLNKICCYYSQDILYRDIRIESDSQIRVCQTLAKSTHLSRRVRSFSITIGLMGNFEFMAKSLQNMTSLRNLTLFIGGTPTSILDGCSFKLDWFSCDFSLDKSLRDFLNGQPSLTRLAFLTHNFETSEESFEATCLPNLTRFTAECSWLPQLIRGRPVSEVNVLGNSPSFDFSCFSLSTAPIQKLTIEYCCLDQILELPLTSTLPSLVHLTMISRSRTAWAVCRSPLLFYFSILNKYVIEHRTA
jgi:hypothetical protein